MNDVHIHSCNTCEKYKFSWGIFPFEFLCVFNVFKIVFIAHKANCTHFANPCQGVLTFLNIYKKVQKRNQFLYLKLNLKGKWGRDTERTYEGPWGRFCEGLRGHIRFGWPCERKNFTRNFFYLTLWDLLNLVKFFYKKESLMLLWFVIAL